MGAKFKAPLDSRCFAEMEEQHFRLPLPPYVCLSFALLSFLSFSASTSLSLPPCFVFHPPFIPSLYLASSPLLFFSPPPPSHCLLLFLLSIFNSAVRLVLRRPSFVLSPLSLYLNLAFITYASLSNLTDIDQRAAVGMLSWCKFVHRAQHLTLEIQTEP